MAPNPPFAVEQATPEEATKYFYEWSNSEQWNPSRGCYEIAQVHMKVDPAGFLIGRITDSKTQQKTMVSIISAMHYGDKQGWIGYNICDPNHRNKGYGLQQFLDAMRTYAPNAYVGLDGVMAQTANYRKSGFVHTAWINERRHGPIKDLVATLGNDAKKHAAHLIDGLKIANKQQFGKIEKEASGLDREGFAERWVAFHSGEEHRFSVAYLSEDRQTVLGYGCVRPAVTSYRVGPLYAASEEIASAILVELGHRVLEAYQKSPLEGVQPMFDIDVPDKNKAAMALFNRLGWPNTFSCARMWAGPGVPECNVDKLWAVCTLEVG